MSARRAWWVAGRKKRYLYIKSLRNNTLISLFLRNGSTLTLRDGSVLTGRG